MGRESSHGTKELFNLPHVVLKARHPSALPFALFFFWLEVGLGLVIEDKPTDFSWYEYS